MGGPAARNTFARAFSLLPARVWGRQRRGMSQILVLDDNVSVRESVRMILAPTWTLAGATLSDDVGALLAREPAELIVLGLSSPLNRPLRVLRQVLLADPRVRVLLLAETALLGVAQRIFNYRIEAILPKPFDAHVLRARVSAILSGTDHLPSLREEVARAESEPSLSDGDLAILLPPPLHPFVKRATATTAPMVIEGERGTGKSALAHFIHHESPWHAAPYLRLDARTLTEEHLAMSFHRVAESAPMGERRGTVCIEEAGLLAPYLQLLVRDLAEGNHPPGTPASVRKMSFRFLATTTDSLVDLVAGGSFREDLRQALSVLVVRLPPLRERTEEIAFLAHTFVEDWARRYARADARLAPPALDHLRAYLWPGNLRELRAVVGRALALTDGNEIFRDAIVLVDDAAQLPLKESVQPAPVRETRPEEETAGVEGVPPETIAPPQDILVHLLAHEVKNPLLAIKTFAQLIETKFDDPDFREDFYRVVSDDVGRIDALVEAASAFAQFGPPRPTSVDVNAMFDRILKHHERTFLRKRIVVLRESDEPAPRALADREQLQYALRCIISKAVDLIPEGGDIHFAITLLPPEAGWSPRVQTRIVFANPEGILTQVAAVVGAEAPAHGTPGSLELTLATQTVIRQGGRLHVESPGDRDTIITLILPSVQDRNPF